MGTFSSLLVKSTQHSLYKYFLEELREGTLQSAVKDIVLSHSYLDCRQVVQGDETPHVNHSFLIGVSPYLSILK